MSRGNAFDHEKKNREDAARRTLSSPDTTLDASGWVSEVDARPSRQKDLLRQFTTEADGNYHKSTEIRHVYLSCTPGIDEILGMQLVDDEDGGQHFEFNMKPDDIEKKFGIAVELPARGSLKSAYGEIKQKVWETGGEILSEICPLYSFLKLLDSDERAEALRQAVLSKEDPEKSKDMHEITLTPGEYAQISSQLASGRSPVE